MRQLNGRYTPAYNRRHRRVGHLFQGGFTAILVEKNAHLLELGPGAPGVPYFYFVELS
ncbi:MAG TPA: hypothetical protein VJ746_12495 [Nitrospira sp.]|nr:hypothetical protein [Nitrospira sp.]